MQSLPKRFRNICLGMIGVFLLFFAFLYSDNTMVGYSEFSFVSGTTYVNTMTFAITGGETTGFTIMTHNKESIPMTYHLSFVDGGITTDGFDHLTCLGVHEDQDVGRYITGDTTPFVLNAGASGTTNIQVTFPHHYSGTYYGCIALQPDISYNTSAINTLPRKGIFLEATVYSNTFPITIKAFPSNRVYQATNNANTGIIKIYDTNKQLISTSPLFTLNANGTGTTDINIPPGTYYIVFKGQSHLASYLSGKSLLGNGNDIFDFTTGNTLYNTQQLNDAEDDGYRYQTAGDLKNSQGVYDFTINGNDIAILTVNGLQEGNITVLDPRNLNGDASINASDISVIGVNFAKTDPYFENTMFTW